MPICQILILHGWGTSSKSWQKIKKLLEDRGQKVFLPDLPGFGQTSPPPRSWSVDDYLKWIKEYIEKENLSSPFLLGHSFGGRIAIKFAAKYPEKLAGLILVGAAGLNERKKTKIFFFLIFSKLGRFFCRLPFLIKFQPRLRKILYFLAKSDYASLSGTMKETFKKIIAEDLRLYLSQIKVPTLIIWGEKDKIVPLKTAYLIKEKIPHSVLEVFSQVGHNPHLERPEIFTKKILNFLNTYGYL